MSTKEIAAPKPAINRQRVQGFMLCLIGSALALAMTVAAWQNAATFLQPGVLIDGERFNGSAEQGRYALALFIAVAFTGLAFVAIGAHRLWTGRRDQRLLWVGALPLGITVILLWQLRALLPQ